MYNAIRRILENNSNTDFAVVESFEILGQAARYAPIPNFLFDSCIGRYLQQATQSNTLWQHQAQALNALGNGDNVVVSTGTASGKSLVFQSMAFHKVLLNPKSRVLVFYPLKALAADQFRRWQAIAGALGLGQDEIGRIDGSVLPIPARDEILQRARIVIMPPDVCHAWLMSRLALPVVRDFVRSLSILVMDEAHTLEGVFGSNFAFLIRRLIAARNHLLRDDAGATKLQLVAATATIANPEEHMKSLTGSDFSVISHDDDGAPQSSRFVAHLACQEDKERQVIRTLHNYLLSEEQDGAFITFIDSRQGVEKLAMTTEGSEDNSEFADFLTDADVLPYRAGFDKEDRQQIEHRLQSGNLRGVVSTSALELGIDIPHLRVGFNVGVPATRKAYRQRLGRVGRGQNYPGAFAVVAPANEFSKYGITFREYHKMSIERSYLYLDNRFMQFAHGRCLVDELQSLGAQPKTPTQIAWPRGFSEIHSAARPGGNRPPEFDEIASLGGDTPHYGYPLRNVGEVKFQIKRHATMPSIGDVNQLQALRECYPGATYRHLGQPYIVSSWSTMGFEPFILVRRGIRGRSTTPRGKTWINAELTPADFSDNRVRRGENGFLAECNMLITERVEGFVEEKSGNFYSYQELQRKDPNMKARSRNFRTSGVVLYINHERFRNTSFKRAFADLLRDIFVREYSVSPQDIGSASSNIAVRTLDESGIRGGCVVVFDETYGSLRLTEQLYLNFEHVLERMFVAAATEVESDDNSVNPLDVNWILEECLAFSVPELSTVIGIEENAPTGYERVFAAGSRVCYRLPRQATVMDVTIIQPALIGGQLMYQVEIVSSQGTPVRHWIAASSVEPSAEADAWEYAWWNCETQGYENPPDDENDDEAL